MGLYYTSQNKILIIAPSWLGDLVMAQALFKQLRLQNTNVVIDVAAPKWSAAVLPRMLEVQKIIELPFKHGELALLQRYRLAKQLQKNNYNKIKATIYSLTT